MIINMHLNKLTPSPQGNTTSKLGFSEFENIDNRYFLQGEGASIVWRHKLCLCYFSNCRTVHAFSEHCTLHCLTLSNISYMSAYMQQQLDT